MKNLLMLLLTCASLFAQGRPVSYDNTTRNVTPTDLDYTATSVDVTALTVAGSSLDRSFHTGASVTFPWTTNEHAVHLSADTTFGFSLTPSDTNFVSGPHILVVGDGASALTNTANSIVWHPTYPGIVPSGTNEMWFNYNGGLIHGYLGWKSVATNGIVIQNDNGLFGITASSQIQDAVSDESGTGALIFAGGNIAAATATTPSAGDNDTSVATTAFVNTALGGMATLFKDGSLNAISNTTSSTSVFTNTTTFTANLLGTNGQMVIYFIGNIINDTGGNLTLTFTNWFGASQVINAGTSSIPDGAAGATYPYFMEWTISNMDSASSQYHMLRLHIGSTQATEGVGGLNTSTLLNATSWKTTAVDTTAAQTFGMAVTPSASGVSSITRRYMVIYKR